MTRFLIALLAASVAAPAIAQHQGHTMPMPAPKPAAKPAPKPAAEPAPRKAPPKAAPKATARPKAAATPAGKAPAKPATAGDPHAGHAMPAAPPTDPHAGHDMSATPAPAEPADPHAGHDMNAMPQEGTADPMAGHDMDAMPQEGTADPMAGHDMSTMGQATPAPPVAPPPAEAFSGPEHAADTVFGREASAEAREQFLDEHGNVVTYRVLIDQLEWQIRDGRDGYRWDGQAWYGGDINKLWIKSEGEGSFGESPEQAEIQALYNRSIDPWFNLQAGVRYDFQPNPERAHLVLGIQGLAPYWFEVDGALFLSDEGDLTARFEAEYDQRITQKLILQPRIEFNLAAQNIPEIGVGSGLSDAEVGLRLRYEFVPEFAPYIGVQYERAFGNTADFARARGEDVGGWSLLLGLRTWF